MGGGEPNLCYKVQDIKESGKQNRYPIVKHNKANDIAGPWKNVCFRMFDDYCTGSQISEYSIVFFFLNPLIPISKQKILYHNISRKYLTMKVNSFPKIFQIISS